VDICVVFTSINARLTLRGQGLGSWTLAQFLSAGFVKQKDAVICWPIPFPYNVDSTRQQWNDDNDKVVAFFRKVWCRELVSSYCLIRVLVESP